MAAGFLKMIVADCGLVSTFVNVAYVDGVFETGLPFTVETWGSAHTVSFAGSKRTVPVSAKLLIPWATAPVIVSYPMCVPADKIGNVGAAALSITTNSPLGSPVLICAG